MLALSLVFAGCQTDETAACRDDVPPDAFDPTTPAVSFSRDVMPIFGQSCAFSSCHSSASSNFVSLGDKNPTRVHDAIVDVRATQLPAMSYVKPGDPRESFLMRKLDGSQCVLDRQCTEGTCGQSMPRNDDPLPIETRDTVRRWIAQGAKND